MHFTSNFAPNINKAKINNKKKIFLKNFFIFVLLLKNSNNIKNVSIFIKPKQRRSLVMLRAPYRYKLARLHLTVNRYNIAVHLKIKISESFNFNSILQNHNNFTNLGKSFESIFIHQKKYTFSFKIVDKTNYLLNSFTVIFVKYNVN